MPTWKHQKQSLFHLCNGPSRQLRSCLSYLLVISCRSVLAGAFWHILFLKCLNHLKSLQTLGDGQDPYFARLEWRRSSLFRDEIHDLPRGTSQIPRPLSIIHHYPMFFIHEHCAVQAGFAFWRKTPRFPKHNEVHVCDLLRERCTGFPCDERSSNWIAQQNGCQIDNHQRLTALLWWYL